MRKSSHITLLVSISYLLSGVASGQESSGYSITDFLAMVFFNELKVSPDARHVAFIVARDDFEKNRNVGEIWKIELDFTGRKTGETRLTSEPGAYSMLNWSPDGRFLAYLSATKSPQRQLQVLDTQNGKLFLLTDSKKFTKGIRAYDWSTDGRAVVFAAEDAPTEEQQKSRQPANTELNPSAQETPIRTNFYRLATADFGQKEAQFFASMEDNLAEFTISTDEKMIAYRPVARILLLDTSGKQPPRRLTKDPVICGDPNRTASMLEWTDAGLLVHSCWEEKDDRSFPIQRRIYSLSPQDGSLKQLGADFKGEFRDHAELSNGGLLTVGVVSTKADLYYIEPASGKTRQIAPGFGAIGLVSASPNGKLAAFSAVNDSHYPELYIAPGIDQLSKAKRVTNFNSRLNQMPPPTVETIRWDNKEGDTVEGVLFWPPGKKEAKNLPFIVDIHGGPYGSMTESLNTHYSVNWAHYAALLASRGYLVLQPNFRGSPGRGDAFMQALVGYPCSRPVADVLTGVDYVVAQGWADLSRLGVMGASYGGRIANCVIGQTTRFKAAVSTSGIWNTTSAFGTSGGANITPNNKAPWEDLKLYWDESGISRAANIKTPTIITIGAEDATIHPAQAQEQYRAFRWLNVPSKLLMFPGEGHRFSKPSNKRIKVEAEIAWLDRYILGKPLPKPQ